MWAFEDLQELALVCAHQALVTARNRGAAELWRLATQYQAEAAKVGNGKVVNIGKRPRWAK